jgi:hypothetical protein
MLSHPLSKKVANAALSAAEGVWLLATLPWYVARRRRLVAEWAEWLALYATRNGSKCVLSNDNAVMLETDRRDCGTLTVSWVVCDRHGLTHTLRSMSFEVPAQAFDTFRRWSDFYLSPPRHARWWRLPKTVPEVPQ